MKADNPELALRRKYAADDNKASYFWECERNGLVQVAEYDVSGGLHTVLELPPAPYRLHARSYRSQEGLLKHFFIDIEPGMEPIWEHRGRITLGIMDGYYGEQEALIFGRRHATGREEVLLVYADGASFEFNSTSAARAHVK